VILSSVRLKMFVIYDVSLPTYVKLAHFCVVWVVICFPGWGLGVCVVLSEEVVV